MKTSLTEIQTWISGSQVRGEAVFDGISTDSRTVGKGQLFVALRGDNFDAHDFLLDVTAKGVAAVVAERLPADFSLPAIVVKDSRLALGEIARNWRSGFDLPVIGVTGSNGKTTVKEMIAAILRMAYGGRFLATAGNLNNDIGVPQTLFRLDSSHRAAVIELGMSHPGEIAYLSAIVKPMVGLVNNAQREHQEFMINVEAVAQENGSVIRALPSDGVAVFPFGDAFSGLWEAYALETGARRIMTFGFEEGASVKGQYDPGRSRLDIHVGETAVAVQLNVIGEHNAHNALAVAACCHAIGIGSDVIAQGLESFQPVNGRLQRKIAANGANLIDDTYNANPDSVLAAIDVLVRMPSPRVLVLGDMGEVGSEGARFHEEVGIYAREKGVDYFFVLGELVRHAVRAYGASARHFEDVAGLMVTLREVALPSATILVKGSRFMKMERVVSDLIEKE